MIKVKEYAKKSETTSQPWPKLGWTMKSRSFRKNTSQENSKANHLRLSLFEETKTLRMVKMIAMRVMANTKTRTMMTINGI